MSKSIIEKKNTYAHRERERSLEDSKISTSKKSQRGEGRDKQRDTQGDRKIYAIILIMNKFIDNNDIIISAQNDTIT